MSRMRAAKYPQADLAAACGVTQSFVSRVLGRQITGTEGAEAVWARLQHELVARERERQTA